MKRRYITMALAIAMAVALVLSACGGGQSGGDTPSQPAQSGGGGGGGGGEVEKGYQADAEKDVITIRAVRPSTGVNAIFEQTSFGPQYRMWADEINQAGGVYVKSLDRQVMVDVQVYDDGSDITKTTQLFEQIVASEKPDLVLAPEGTASLFACSPIAQKYDYLLLAAEGGAKELENYLPPLGDNTNTFSILSYSETQVPALIKFFEEQGVESVYCVYVDDLHGTEYWGYTKSELEKIGIDIKGSESAPLEGDFDADAVVNNAMRSDADAFLVYTYPGNSIPITASAAKLGYNPKMYLVGPGGCYDFFGAFSLGDPTNIALDGMIGWGAWNEKSTAHGTKAKEYSEHFQQYWIEKGLFWKNADGSFGDIGGGDTVFQDWWGHICYYSVMQILQQALENAGELMDDGRINNLTLVDYIANNSFDTVMHTELRFTNNILLDDMYLGNIGQWQGGVFEVIDVDDRRTADPWYPKPAWPQE
ncbi:MAG: ABC transporter substrate-binding protein [Clostridiales bacterium]|nr:ABC transporter substrate-binding protein [Clostridiales bacterium]